MQTDTFRFKQFQINQTKSVHRVGTDGVLLGAWVSVADAKKMLDIGTGTGVMALMLAQRSPAQIDAIEVDDGAFTLANSNIKASPFANRIRVWPDALQQFEPRTAYDLVVCNPPFFEKSLKPLAHARQQQRHTDTLPFEVLLHHAQRLLHSQGRLAVIVPVESGNRLSQLASSSGLCLTRACAVTTKAGKPQERWLLEFSRNSQPTVNESLTIMNSAGHWTAEYQLLTREFYLKF
jgi:tRNA1Val (adenine37-N6)-methyltransferase